MYFVKKNIDKRLEISKEQWHLRFAFFIKKKYLQRNYMLKVIIFNIYKLKAPSYFCKQRGRMFWFTVV